jgi:lipopolysaccharide transport system permease protein
VVKHLQELYRYRELLLMIAWRDIKVKYKQSVMGFLWAIFMPMLIVCAGILVKFAISTLSGKPLARADLISVSVKAVPWAFLIASIRFGTNSLMANRSLVTKIYFPKEIFPIAAVLSSLFDFGVATVFLAIVVAFLGAGWSAYILLLPLLAVILVAMATGLSIILSSLNLFFRDVKYLVEVILTFAIFFTPVLYDVDMFGDKGRILLLNPVAPILEAVNACVVLHKPPELGWLLYSGIFSFLLLSLAYWNFKALEPTFAERI